MANHRGRGNGKYVNVVGFSDDGRRTRIAVSFSETEFAEIKRAAEKLDMPVATLVRSGALENIRTIFAAKTR
jgi:hypothetical protein